jgi:hypothetical protein
MRVNASKTVGSLATAVALVATLSLVPGRAAAVTAGDYRLGDTLNLNLGGVPGGEALAKTATSATPARASVGTFWIGPAIGLEIASNTTMFAIRLPMQYVLSEIDHNVFLDFAGHVGASFGSDLQLYEFLPSARLRYAISPKVAIYGDGGLGLAIQHVSAGLGDTSVGGIVRFGAGFQVGLTPNMLLMVEPAALSIYFVSGGSATAYSLLVGLLFRAG